MGIILNLVNQKFGRLKVMSKSGKNKHGKTLWLCHCECGNTTNVSTSDLRNSHTKSCGCLNAVRIKSGNNYRHGKINSPEYGPWTAMRARCHNPNSKAYLNYGGRGIEVCNRWDTFSNFLEDMGPRPTMKHTIERRDVNGNYEPSNCYWLEKIKQARNTRVTNSRDCGVTLDQYDKWRVRITVDKKRIHVGKFEDKEEAIKARREAEIKYWGKSS